jgi:hypothetical protein
MLQLGPARRPENWCIVHDFPLTGRIMPPALSMQLLPRRPILQKIPDFFCDIPTVPRNSSEESHAG